MTTPTPENEMTVDSAKKAIEFFNSSGLKKDLDDMAEYFRARGFLQGFEKCKEKVIQILNDEPDLRMDELVSLKNKVYNLE